MKQDLTKCPQCGGEADNGHDRCYPPNPYWCTKCQQKEIEIAKALMDYPGAAA